MRSGPTNSCPSSKSCIPHGSRFFLRVAVIGILLQTSDSFLLQTIHENIRHRPPSRLMASARQLIGQGMQSFRSGDVEESIRYFDQAEAAESSITPYLWQRGLSYYYADQFDLASKQFRADVRVNPADAEEIVWDIASQLQLRPEAFPVPNQLALPRKDSRRIMSSVYQLFRGEGTEKDLAVAGQTGSAADTFYAAFYLGLYNEVRQDNTKASSYMRQAMKTPYAKLSTDYMAACAKVHVMRRGWDSP